MAKQMDFFVSLFSFPHLELNIVAQFPHSIAVLDVNSASTYPKLSLVELTGFYFLDAGISQVCTQLGLCTWCFGVDTCL